MVSKKVTIVNGAGLHARPASVLAKAAGKCSSEAVMLYNGKSIQMKSILNIMAAAIKAGSEVEIQCSGPAEKQDLISLVSLIESGLGE